MTNDRVEAKIDIIKGRDETNDVKNTLGGLSKNVDGVKESFSGASDHAAGFGDALANIRNIAIGIGLERLTEKVIDLGKQFAIFSTDYASNMEQARIAFDAFTGSVELGGKALSDVAEFARKTPFELPEVVDAGKQLLGFHLINDNMDNLQTRLREVGSLSAATNKPMSVAIDLFARAKEGMFNIREFGQFGIGRDALEQFGVQFSKAGEVINKSELLPSLEKLINARFGDMLDKESKTLKGTVNNIKDDFGRLAGAFMGIETSGQNIGQAKKGSLFEMLQKDTEQFYNWIESHQKQISEFGNRIAAAIRIGAEALINWIVGHKDEIIAFGSAVITTFGKIADWILNSFIPTLTNMYHWVEQNRWILAVVAGVLGGVLIVAIVGVISAVGGFIAAVIAAIGTVAAFVTSAVGIAVIIGGVVVGAIALAILYWDQLKTTIYNVGTWIKGFAIDIANSVIDMINGMLGALEGFINGAAKLASKIPGVKMDMAQLGRLGRLEGGNGKSFDIGSALIGGAIGGPAGIAGAAASYMTSSNNKNITINNNNNISNGADVSSLANQMGWQVSGR